MQDEDRAGIIGEVCSDADTGIEVVTLGPIGIVRAEAGGYYDLLHLVECITVVV